MAQTTLEFDAVIIGGGVAGLWLLNVLVNSGYNAVLLEQQALGCGQSIASQGMIHGGVKYTLAGALTGASEAIADMPDLWRTCLHGEGPVDLRQTRSLSEHFYMWSTASTLSRLTGFFASKALRGRVKELKAADYPAVFRHSAFKGNVYELVDTVIDTPSLLANLASNMAGRIFKVDWQQSRLCDDPQTSSNTVHLQLSVNVLVKAQQFIFAAGQGNAQLLQNVGAEQPQMQLRPLQQVMVKHNFTEAKLYAHCMGKDTTPRLTISSHPCADGKLCWYLGGQLAERGVGKAAVQLIEEAKHELAALFPQFDWQQADYACHAVERAEPRQNNLARPDNAFWARAQRHGQDMGNVCVAWPTKLTLAPHLGQMALASFQQWGINAGSSTSGAEQLALPPAPVAPSPWEQAAWQTT